MRSHLISVTKSIIYINSMNASIDQRHLVVELQGIKAIWWLSEIQEKYEEIYSFYR